MEQIFILKCSRCGIIAMAKFNIAEEKWRLWITGQEKFVCAICTGKEDNEVRNSEE